MVPSLRSLSRPIRHGWAHLAQLTPWLVLGGALVEFDTLKGGMELKGPPSLAQDVLDHVLRTSLHVFVCEIRRACSRDFHLAGLSGHDVGRKSVELTDRMHICTVVVSEGIRAKVLW